MERRPGQPGLFGSRNSETSNLDVKSVTLGLLINPVQALWRPPLEERTTSLGFGFVPLIHIKLVSVFIIIRKSSDSSMKVSYENVLPRV